MKKFLSAIGKAAGYFGSYFVVINVASLYVVIAYITAEMLYYDRIFGSISSGAFSQIAYLATMLGSAAFVFLLFLFFRMREKSFAENVGMHKVTPWKLIFPLLLGFSFQLVLTLLMAIIPIPQSMVSNYENLMQYPPSAAGIVAIDTVIVAPIVEEILFRGLIFGRMKKGMRTVFALILQALVFGAAHGNWIQGCYATVLGVALGLVYLKFDSIWASVMVHFGFNLSSYLMSRLWKYMDTTFLALVWLCAGLAVTVLLGVAIAHLDTKGKTKTFPRIEPFEESALWQDDAKETKTWEL